LGGKERSLWRDRLGHLGPGFDRFEGYVFYATIYARSPELLQDDIPFDGPSDFPSRELDRVFRKIAWQAVIHNPLSGVTDGDHDGIGDQPATRNTSHSSKSPPISHEHQSEAPSPLCPAPCWTKGAGSNALIPQAARPRSWFGRSLVRQSQNA